MRNKKSNTVLKSHQGNKSKFLCYLDILGFKNRITEGGFKRCYKNILKEVIEPYDYPDKVFFVSDSIIVLSENFRELAENSFSIYSIALKQGLFLRGAITKGQIIDIRIINGYDSPRPRQIGSVYTGSQQPLGALNPFDGAA
jgi:hypothetical protein